MAVAILGLDSLFGSLSGPLKTFIGLAYIIYNRLLSKGLSLLLTPPDLWMDGEGWTAVSTFENSFVILASSLATVLWLIGYVTEMTDIKSQVTLESEIKLFARILLTDTFIVGAFSMVQELFSIVDKLVGISSPEEKKEMIGTLKKGYKLVPPQKFLEEVEALSGVEAVLLTVVGIIFFLAMVVSGGIICYMVFMRFFNILAAVPYAVLANATIAGNREISRTAYGYWKNLIASILSAVTMMIGLKLSSMLSSSGTLSLVASADSGAAYVLAYMVQTLLIVLLTAGFIKKADDLTHRWIGG